MKCNQSFHWAVVLAGTIVTGFSADAPTEPQSTVGFIRVTLPVGFSLVANPLKTESDRIGDLLAAVPEGCMLYKFGGSPAGFSINAYNAGWDRPDETLSPGEGAFFLNPGPGPLTLVFMGEVLQGTLANPISQGFSLKSSMAAISGEIDADLGFPAAEGDMVFRYRRAANPHGYSIHTYEFGTWNLVPRLDLGEAVFVNKIAPANWVKTFSIAD